MVSQKEIAAKAGVSLATASLALNNHPRVSARTRQRVVEVANKLGYVPNHAARKLAQRRFDGGEARSLDRIAFVISEGVKGQELVAPYLALLKGAEHNVSSRGGTLIFLRCDSESRRQKLTALAHSGDVDGWLLVGMVDDELVRLVKSLGHPFVVLGDHHCSEQVNSVVVDNQAIGSMAVRHLAAAGHTRIGLMGGSMYFDYQKDVLAGYRSALNELGLEADPKLVETFMDSPVDTDMSAMFDHLLILERPPTAIFLAEPSFGAMALFVLRHLANETLNAMPLVANEIEGFSAVNESVDVIESPLSEVGRAGVSLLREIAEERSVLPRRVLVTPRLMLKR